MPDHEKDVMVRTISFALSVRVDVCEERVEGIQFNQTPNLTQSVAQSGNKGTSVPNGKIGGCAYGKGLIE
jgi:hypothetical protein